jgi:TrmH family RNA methyltransferase
MPTRTASQLHRLREVSSRGNALVKELRRALSQGEPVKEGWIGLEGLRVIEEAIRSGLRLHAVFVRESSKERAERLLPQLSHHVETVLLPDSVFDSAVATEHSQGVAALASPRASSLEEILTAPVPLVVITAGIQDPGNFGTLLRSAEAFGASGVVACEGNVAPFNAKVVRAAAGSLFRLPVVTANFAECLPQLRERKLRLLATSSHKGTDLDKADLRGPCCILIGNEGAGLPRQILSEVDETIVIPHAPQVESLNAGVAASIVLYEAARQRKCPTSA